MKIKFLCPACGFKLAFEPWFNPSDPSFRNCPSCLIEFGYHDEPLACGKKGTRESLWAEWRDCWEAEGMPWRGPKKMKPKDWHPEEQLKKLRNKKEIKFCR